LATWQFGNLAIWQYKNGTGHTAQGINGVAVLQFSNLAIWPFRNEKTAKG